MNATTAPMCWTKLSDASCIQPALAPARGAEYVEVYYVKPEHHRDWRCGSEGRAPGRFDTHDLLGSVAKLHDFPGSEAKPDGNEARCDDIFAALQGENWSPNGEARTLIQRLGFDHTSMSVGDAVLFRNPADETQSEWFVCENSGWNRYAYIRAKGESSRLVR